MSEPTPSPSSHAPLALRAYTATSACGVGRQALREALQAGRSALVPNTRSSRPLATWVGEVPAADAPVLPASLAAWDCRNHRLAWLGLQADGYADAVAAAVRRHGAHRVGVVMGTSTSSIGATEQAYRERDSAGRLPAWALATPVHTLHALGRFVQTALGLGGPSLTVSTACSSSAKAFGVAARWLRLGLADAVVVGGVDSLCDSVLFGFASLQLLSAQPCRPFDAARSGISLAEAAGYALLERADAAGEPAGTLRLRSVGESSDAHHMSAPHPEGRGAELALDEALSRAGLRPADVDYLNLHGTASLQNDAVEAAMVARRFGPGLHAGSTKGCTGHALGAAGILEAVVCLLALKHGLRPGTPGLQTPDPVCGPQIRPACARGPVQVAVSHSFGFGGSNAVLVLDRVPA